jgi:hypothetical protein
MHGGLVYIGEEQQVRGGGQEPAIRSLSLWAENGWKENIERMMDLCSVAL